MAQPNLDNRVDEARKQLEMLTGPQVPISGPDDQPQPNSGFIPSPGPGQPSRMTLNPQGFPDARQAVESQNPQLGNTAAASENPASPLATTDSPTPAATNALPLPTPEDDTPQVMDQRRAQALEALKADGFDGYTPDVTDAQLDPNQQHMLGKAITDIGAGFNVSLAKTLSLPRETVERGMGLLGLDYMQHGGPQQQTIDALNRMGIPAYEVDNLANKIGEGALPALATWAAMQLAAPAMAANTGVGMFSYMAQNMGEWALKHPVVGMWLGQAAQAGGETAINATGSDNVATRVGGELAGGMAPGAVKSLAKIPLKVGATLIPGSGPLVRNAGRMAGEGINTIADNLPTDLGNAIKKYNPLYQAPKYTPNKEGLINDNLDANRLQTFAQDQIVAAQTYQDKAIEQAINAIPSVGNPAQLQNRTHELLLNAEKISKGIVSDFWRRVPLKAKIDVGDLRGNLFTLKKELVDLENQRPDVMIDKILETVQLRRGPDGKFLPPPKPTVQKLRDFQSQIGTAITEERARDAPREGMVRNLARISEMIDDNIAAQLPNNTSIEQARQMSKRHNDLFSRGPINDVLSKRRTGDFRVPQGDSIEKLMQKTNGLQALRDVQEGVSSYPQVPSNKFRPKNAYTQMYAVNPAEKQQLDDLISSAQDTVRSLWREAADKNPAKGVAFSLKHDEDLKALGSVAGQLQWGAQKVASALASKKEITASSLARFAQTSGDNAVKNIFAQKDPATVAKQLMISFRGDPDALEGLRNQVLNEFIYIRGKQNPNVIQSLIKEPRYGSLLETVLSKDQLERLNRMVNSAVQIGAEDMTSWKTMVKTPVRTIGRLAGAMIGRRVAPGTLQGPAMFSKGFGSFMERSLGGTDPADLFSQAVIDPHWEALLYSRIPTTTREMRTAAVHYKRLFAGINSAQQDVLKRLSKDNEDGLD